MSLCRNCKQDHDLGYRCKALQGKGFWVRPITLVTYTLNPVRLLAYGLGHAYHIVCDGGWGKWWRKLTRKI